MARKLLRISWVIIALTIENNALGAYYRENSWFLSGGMSYSVIQPGDLNQSFNQGGDAPKFEGLVGFTLRGERGLARPNWTHWVEISYYFNGVSSLGDTGAYYEVTHKHWTVIPLGVTYFFARTAYIDFGVAGGLGLGFAHNTHVGRTGGTLGSLTEDYTGGISPVFDLRGEVRFWLGNQLGILGVLGFRYHSLGMTSTSGSTLTHNLMSLSGGAMLTWAIGGVKGTGRTFVEVLPGPSEKVKRRQIEPEKDKNPPRPRKIR